MTVTALYGPVASDLERVEEIIVRSADIDNAPVSAILRQVVTTTGKRLRPALACLAGGIHGAHSSRLDNLAAAVEILHMATLVHDDFIDDSGTRRGQPTVHTLLGGRAALLIGDYLFARAAILCAETGDANVVRIFASALLSLCDGELRQAYGSLSAIPTREDYYRRIRSKTAELFRVASEAGAIIGECTTDETRALSEYGLSLGIAFQISDDILDFTGSAKQMGKPAGSDLRNGVITLPTMIYLDANPADTELVVRLTGEMIGQSDGDEEPVEQREADGLTRRIVASGAIELALSEARHHCDKARLLLEVLPDGAHRRALEAIACFVSSRHV